MIESWLIKAIAPLCGTDQYFCAFSDGNPTEKVEFRYVEESIIEDLWDDYSYLLHLEDEEYESDEEEAEVYDQAYEDWRCDSSITAEPMSYEEIITDWDSDIEIVYDERKS